MVLMAALEFAMGVSACRLPFPVCNGFQQCDSDCCALSGRALEQHSQVMPYWVEPYEVVCR